MNRARITTLSDHQRELARKARALEAACIETLQSFPVSAEVLSLGAVKLTRAEQIPPALDALHDVRANLTTEERHALGVARQQWEQAQALSWALAETVLGMVKARALKFVNLSTLDMDDLIQEGLAGAYRAALRYNPKRQTFSTYAGWWVRAAMSRAIDETGREIRTPGGATEQRRKLKITRRILGVLGETVTEEVLAQESGLELRRVRQLLRSEQPISLSCPANGEQAGGDDPLTVGEMICDPTMAPDERAALLELRDRLPALMEGLDSRAVFVLEARFGLTGGAPMTLSEIGQGLGLSRERARQIEKVALLKLREALTSRPAPPPSLADEPTMWEPEKPYRQAYRRNRVTCVVKPLDDGRWRWQVWDEKGIRASAVALSWAVAVKGAEERVTGRWEIPDHLIGRRAA